MNIIRPAPGQQLKWFSKVVISWRTSSPDVGPYMLELSCDNGQSWELIGSVCAGTELAWLVPPLPAAQNQYRIRVQSPTQCAVSEPFSIVEQFSLESVADYTGCT